MSSHKLDANVRAYLAASGDRPIDLIIRTTGRPAQYAAVCAASGIQIRHSYNLLPGMAVTAPASVILSLADEDWITSIEPDREVRTMS